MGDIKIKYTHIKKTDAIEQYVINKFSKLEKFLRDNNNSAIVNIVDDTPHKKTPNIGYKIVVNLKNIEKGKNIKYAITHKAKDLYAGIDEVIDKLLEMVRRNHDKNTERFKNVRRQIMSNYMNLWKQIT